MCKSGEVRRSRWRPEDGPLGKLFFSRYRCRDCRARFSRFSGGKFAVVAAVGLVFVAAVVGGLALSDYDAPGFKPDAAEPRAIQPTVATPDSSRVTTPAASPGLARLAEKGEAQAQFSLAMAYLNGRGVLQNFQTAFKWFDQAAQQNHAESQYRLGLMYRNGHGVGIDKTKAYVWFNLAAAQGHARAAEERDRLLPTLTSDQIALAQRESQSWRPSSAKP